MFHSFADHVGLLKLSEQRMTKGVTILTYHRVLPDERCRGYPFASLAMPAAVFRKQMQWLSEHCRVLTVREAFCNGSLEESVQRPIVCLTFDDGYSDNYDIAAAVLNEHGLRGTFFVTAGLVGTGRELWFDLAARQWRTLRCEERRTLAVDVLGIAGKQIQVDNFRCWMQFLKQCSAEVRSRILERESSQSDGEGQGNRLMTVNQLVTLHRQGHEIGSHTLSHPLLPQLDSEHLAREVVESRTQLQELLDAEIAGFCYPNGDCDDRVVAAVKSAGYRYACTTCSQLVTTHSDPFRLPRVHVNPEKVVSAGQHNERAFRSELCRLA